MTDTRPFFPEELHGKQMAIGYSSMTRDLKRKPLKPFHTSAITPAAGFTSTVNDLAKFAMWQFRLRGDTEEVLHAYTLAEMQRVHFARPGSNTMRGLGFSVSARDGETFVGHGGSCPGFRTTLSLQNDSKIATVAMVNAMVNAGKYSTGVYNLNGITREVVLQEAEAAGIRTHQAPYSLDDVYGADEAFVTGTFGGLTPVTEVDDDLPF